VKAFRYLHRKNKAAESAMLAKRVHDYDTIGHHVEEYDTESLFVSLIMTPSWERERIKIKE
jgi:hypothetical protein